MQIEIYNDKKEKSDSWEAKLNILLHSHLDYQEHGHIRADDITVFGYGANMEESVENLKEMKARLVQKLEGIVEELKLYEFENLILVHRYENHD